MIEANRPGSDLGRCILVGAFSYLLETIHSAGGAAEQAKDAAIAVSEKFIEINPVGYEKLAEPSVVPLDRTGLTRFAEIISANQYDWTDFSIVLGSRGGHERSHSEESASDSHRALGASSTFDATIEGCSSCQVWNSILNA